MFPIRYVHKVKGHPSLQKGGCHEVHDIEDLVKVGQVVKGPVSLLSRLKCISLKDKNLYVTVSCMRCGPVYYVVWPMNLWRSIWIMFKRQLYPKYQSGAPSHTRFSLREIIMKSESFLWFSGCSYFAARSMAQEAELVFCPYNYIINPVIREAMEVDISQSIIILDEAQYVSSIYLSHNFNLLLWAYIFVRNEVTDYFCASS